jgi:hypothetical protein
MANKSEKAGKSHGPPRGDAQRGRSKPPNQMRRISSLGAVALPAGDIQTGKIVGLIVQRKAFRLGYTA